MSKPKRRTPPSRERSIEPTEPNNGTGRVHPPVRVVELSNLKPAPYNPRAINQDALNGLAASLERFGVVEPIVWNERSGHVVGGHQRLEVLKQRGDQEAQVVVVNLDDKEEKALNVTLNNPNVAGHFTDGLQELLTALKLEDEELMTKLRLDTLVVDFTPVDMGEQGALDKKTLVTCPNCGHEFQG